MYLNKVQIYGNLTRDPELKSLPSGSAVASFGVATNRTWKDKDGSKKEQTEFHNCVAFGKTAEIIAQYMKKGKPIYVEGHMQTRSWEDKESGKKQYKTEVVVETFQFGPSTREDGDRSATSAQDSTENQSQVADSGEIDASEIPF